MCDARLRDMREEPDAAYLVRAKLRNNIELAEDYHDELRRAAQMRDDALQSVQENHYHTGNRMNDCGTAAIQLIEKFASDNPDLRSTVISITNSAMQMADAISRKYRAAIESYYDEREQNLVRKIRLLEDEIEENEHDISREEF